MNTMNAKRTMRNDVRFYETTGLLFLDLGDDHLARIYLERAAALGSEHAKLCVQYLDLHLCDEDFRDSKHPAEAEDEFDYDFQPLFHVSPARTAA